MEAFLFLRLHFPLGTFAIPTLRIYRTSFADSACKLPCRCFGPKPFISKTSTFSRNTKPLERVSSLPLFCPIVHSHLHNKTQSTCYTPKNSLVLRLSDFMKKINLHGVLEQILGAKNHNTHLSNTTIYPRWDPHVLLFAKRLFDSPTPFHVPPSGLPQVSTS